MHHISRSPDVMHYELFYCKMFVTHPPCPRHTLSCTKLCPTTPDASNLALMSWTLRSCRLPQPSKCGAMRRKTWARRESFSTGSRYTIPVTTRLRALSNPHSPRQHIFSLRLIHIVEDCIAYCGQACGSIRLIYVVEGYMARLWLGIRQCGV
jgi:hypothetical protein